MSQTGDWQASSRRPAVVLDREAVEPADRPLEHRMLERVAECMQRDDRPDPRRLDPAPRAVALLPLDDPPLGGPQSLPPEQPDRPAGVGVGRAVDEDEDLPPEIRRDRRGGATREQLVDPEADGSGRLERRDDRQRDDRLACPAAEGVDRERCARGKQDLLGRERRHLLPRPEAEQREPHASEDTALLDAAGLADERRRAGHVRGVARIAGDPERDVGLDRGREIAGAAEIGRPRAVGPLPAADPLGGRRSRGRVEQARGSGAGRCPRRRS